MLVVADSPFSDIVRHERYKSEQNAKAKTKAVRISNFSPEIWARNMIIAGNAIATIRNIGIDLLHANALLVSR